MRGRTVSRDGWLPPGVTGNEFPIAGPDREFDDHRECTSQGFPVKTITDYGVKQIETAIESLRNRDQSDSVLSAINVNAAIARLRDAQSDIRDTDVDGECPFEGDVTIMQYNGIESWECPVCRVVHETEVE